MTSPRKKILIVDDEPDVLDYLAAVFEDNDYETVTAADGLEAFDLAQETQPDLITLDITMPGQSGLQTYRDIKGVSKLKTIPVVIITASADSREQFLNLLDGLPEPEGFLTKPVPTGTLLEMVTGLIP
jgi:CheY-like chemotaxis protein